MTILRHRGKGPYRDGCGFVFLTFLFSCLFLLLNSVLISRFVPAPETAPGLLARPGVNQAVLFVGPVILIFVEWWLGDLVVALVTRRRSVAPLPPERKTPP